MGNGSATAPGVLEVVGLSLPCRQRLHPGWLAERQTQPLPRAAGFYWQQSDGGHAACSACARPAGSQSCCLRVRSKLAAVAPCPPGSSRRRRASPLWPPLALLPSFALLAFPSRSWSIPAPSPLSQESNMQFCVRCRECLSQPCPQQTPRESRDCHNLTATVHFHLHLPPRT